MSSRLFSSLFALVIGINKYSEKSAPPLLGAVADARDIEQYLHKLGVPPANITTLLDEQATRSNIIKGFNELAANPAINSGGPILIYFAGHGTKAPTPSGWYSSRSRIRLIVPYDHHAMSLQRGRLAKVHGIPDRTIGVLLRNIAKAKGNNIVVIFDCSHSGSRTRHRTSRARGLEISEEIPEDLDYEIWGEAEQKKQKDTEDAAQIPEVIDSEMQDNEGEEEKYKERADFSGDIEHYGDATHVLLAACASDQRAFEVNGRGVFTKALVDTLNLVGMERMSYALLIRHLPQLPGQIPRCEGFYKNRVLFSKNELKAEPFYKVDKELQSDEYVLHAGTLHGITKGSEFSLYEEESKDSNLLGSFTVNIVGDLQSIVKWPPLGDPPQYLPMPAFAIQTAFGQTKPLRLYLSDDPKLSYLRTRLEEEIKKCPHLYCMTSREEARFEIIANKNEYSASFAFVNSHIETLGLKRLPFWVSLKPDAEEIIMNIVNSASMFNRFLEYQPLDVDGHREEQKNGAQASGEPISVHFAKLIRTGRTWNPIAEESDESNLSSNNQVDLVSHVDVIGLKVTNKTNEDLYPYLFLFNCNELTVEPWCTSPTIEEENDDVLLQPNESMYFGYNDGPGRPWRHVVKPAEIVAERTIIREKEDMQVEFFKLILTTQPVNLDFIRQSTPFTQHPRAVPYSKLDSTPLEMRKSVLYAVVTVRTEEMYDETH